MLYKSQPVTIMRNANIGDDGYDILKEQILIQFPNETRAVVFRGDLTPETVLVPVMKELPVEVTEKSTTSTVAPSAFDFLTVKGKKNKAKQAA